MKPRNNSIRLQTILLGVSLAALSGGFFVFSGEVDAATGINKKISFQGKVVNATSGTNVTDGNYDFVFRIYAQQSPGGTAVWTETWNSGTAQVSVADGIFQVDLGTHTAFPGSVDFNTDNIYLSVEFNSTNGSGEMTPRVRFAAVPYAFNADKVHGLTVTDTTGTLTIPNGETISFGGSFTTTASNDLTLTTIGATNVTLPVSGTLVTLSGVEELTNKTIGSTGLVFSGASADIATTSGEGLSIDSGTTGAIDIGTSANAKTITFGNSTTTTTVNINSGTGGINFQAAGTGTTDTIQIGAGGSGSATPDYFGLDVRNETGDPVAAGFEGAMYYNTSDNKFRCYQGSAWTDCIGGGTTYTEGNYIDIAGSSIAFDPTELGTVTWYNGTAATDIVWTFDGETNDGTFGFYEDEDAFAITGNFFGIGDTSPDSPLDILATDAAHTYLTLGNTNAGSYNAGIRFELTENSSLFSLGVDDTDNDAFKIYSGSDFSGTSEFAISTDGITTIGQLKVGAQKFEDDAGAISWVDMNVTSASSDNTVERYTAQLDGNDMLTIYALVNGTGGAIDTKRVFIGNGAGDDTLTTLFGLDVKTSASGSDDPADSFEGAMYYNDNLNKFRCYQNTGWTDCIGGGGTTYTEGNYIDIAGSSIAFDPTELGTVTWYNGTAATDIVWTFDGETNDGTFGFYEDEDAFSVTNSSFGIGTTAPASAFELYSSAAADNIFTLTSATTTNDPLLKFRTSTTALGVKFSLGVDASDADTFKIDSGDGLGTSADFKIDSTGVTTIANVRLGAQSFPEDGGILSWTDMSVTSSSADNTVMSYSAQIDSNPLLTVYALSDGAGSIDNKRVQIGAGGAGSTTPVLFGLDVKSTTGNPTEGFEGAMYYNTFDNELRCYVNSAWASCGGGGAITPWASDIDADGYDLNDLSNILFRETTGAPTGTDVGLYRDNTGDLSLNVLTGKTFNIAVNGTDEYNFSSTGIGFNSNNITGLGTGITATAGLTIASTGAGAITLDSATNEVIIATGDALSTSISGNPASPTNGMIWYNSSTNRYMVREGGVTKQLCNGTDLACGTGSGSALSAITLAGAGNTIDNTNYAQVWNWSTLTTGRGFTLDSTATGLTTGGIFALGSSTTAYAHTGTETGSLATITFKDTTSSAVTATTNGLLISPTINATSGAATRTINGLSVAPTFTACSAGTCAVNGLDIANVTDATGFTGSGLNVGTGWDYDIQFVDATPTIRLGATDNTGQLTIVDASGNNIFEVKDLNTNFGATAEAGGFTGRNSYFYEEFIAERANDTASTAISWGDHNEWTVLEQTATSNDCIFSTVDDTVNGIGRINTADASTQCLAYTGMNGSTSDAHLIFDADNLPVIYMKLRPSIAGAAEDFWMGIGDSAAVSANPPDNGIYFTNNDSTTWTGVTRSGSTSTPVTCSGATIDTTKFALLKIEVVSTSSVKFYVDTNASDGVTWSYCGESTSNIPTAGLAGMLKTAATTDEFNFDVDYYRVWQDDAPSSSASSASSIDSPLTVEAAPSVFEARSALVDLLVANEDLEYDPSARLDTQVLAASEGIVAPEVMTQKLSTDMIASGLTSDIAITLAKDGKLTLGSDSKEPSITFDTAGNANFSGTLRAGKIAGLDVIDDRVTALEQTVVGLQGQVTSLTSLNTSLVQTESASKTGDASIASTESDAITSSESDSADVAVIDQSELEILFAKGGLVVEGEAEFLGKTIFRKTTVFNRDAAGFAVIEKGASRVEVHFETPYENRPIVNATLFGVASFALEGADTETLAAFAGVESEFAKSHFAGEVKYLIVNRSERGFTILLNETATDDLEFGWSAMAIDGATISRGVPEAVPTSSSEEGITDESTSSVVPISALSEEISIQSQSLEIPNP